MASLSDANEENATEKVGCIVEMKIESDECYSETVSVQYEGINSIFIKTEDTSQDEPEEDNDPFYTQNTSNEIDVHNENVAAPVECLDSRNATLEDLLKKNYPCELNSYETLLRTKTDSRDGVIFSCEFCSFTSSIQPEFHTHLLVHLGAKRHLERFQMTDQPASSSPDGLQPLVDQTKLLSCENCSYTTKRKYHLVNHIRTHTGEKPFSCTICTFKTNRKTYLKTHFLNHTGERPLSCRYCPFTTIHKSNLNKHVLTHNGKSIFACELCDFRTSTDAQLRAHAASHISLQTLSCPYCSFQTTTMSAFNRHLLLHGEKPFSCELCSYKTKLRFDLKKHALTHTEEKPFSCHLCPYKTKQKINLKTHISCTHNGVKSMSCYLCSFKTNRKRNLRNHIQTHTKEK